MGVTYFSLCRASELYVYSNGKIHKEFGLTRGLVSFWERHTLMLPALRKCAGRVEVRLKGQVEIRNGSGQKFHAKHRLFAQRKIDSEWKEICVGMQIIVPPLDGCGDFEVMLELLIHQQCAVRTISKVRDER